MTELTVGELIDHDTSEGACENVVDDSPEVGTYCGE